MMKRVPNPRRALRGLTQAADGATLVEFAFVAPVLLMMIFGLFDIAHTQYTSSVVNGAMQRSARNYTLQSASTNETALDNAVIAQVTSVAPRGATVTLQKQSVFDFADVGAPEDFTDMNTNARCDPGEPYVDSNNNNRWDANRARDGIGGARDVMIYTANVTYPRLFPLFSMIGLPSNVNLRATTVLRSQPFDQQAARTTTVRNCT
jgi:Flp pilus assembly protein TadG